MESNAGQAGRPVSTKSCNLCGSQTYRPLFSKFGFNIVACSQCSLQYLLWELSPEALHQFYNDGYFTGQEDRHGYLDYAGDADMLTDNFRHKLRDIESRTSPGAILDMGAALGYFVQVAAEAGWQATGLEVSDYASAQARQRGLDVVCGDSLSVFRDRQFKVVTMWDVIEHLNEPAQVLEQVHSVLAPGGSLVLSTGDVGHPLARVLGRHARMYAPPQHLFYFTHATLTRMLRQAGFEIQSIQPDIKVVRLHYVLHVARGLVDNRPMEKLIEALLRTLPNPRVRLTLWDVMIVSATKVERRIPA